MPHTRVNTAAIRIKAADDHIIEPDERGQHAHRGDEPERCVASHGEGEADHVRFARPPIAVQDGGRARHINIARPLNVGWYHRCPLRASAWLLDVNDFLTSFAIRLINAPDLRKLMLISYAVFCLKKKKIKYIILFVNKQ